MRCVVDVKIAIKWVVFEPDSPSALALLGNKLFAPEPRLPECLNVLWHKRVRQALDELETDMALTALAAAQIR